MQITYNLLNLPEVISRESVAQARYIYTADSIKCETTGNANSGYAYLGSLIFNKNAAGYAFESAEFGGGRIINTTGTIAPVYYTTDHLGSVRMITDANGTIQEQNDYYPFGGRHTTGNTYAALPGNNFKFNGKEEQTTGATGYLDYGARMYDNVTGRWGTPDPLAEKYYSLTPYDFCGSNPVSRIDPNGMNWYQNSRGNVMWRNSASDSFMDDNRAIWTNIGATYTHYRSDGSSVFFYQKTNQDGDMTLASHTFSPNETAAFGLFHSDQAREAAMQNHVDPTWGSFLTMVAKEMKAQWTDPYPLTEGMPMSAIGIKNQPIKKGPKPTPNFMPPTNKPQLPLANPPNGFIVRVMPPTQQYPNGYWVLEKPMKQGGFQKINPSSMRPGTAAETHVPLPPNYFNK